MIPLGEKMVDLMVRDMERGLTATEAAMKYWSLAVLQGMVRGTHGPVKHRRVTMFYKQIAYTATEVHEAWAAKYGPNATHPERA